MRAMKRLRVKEFEETIHQKRQCVLNSSTTKAPVVDWKWLELGSIDEYQEKFKNTMTCQAFKGIPFSNMNPAVRGT